MKLREKILAEHSKAQCNSIVDWVGNSRERFNQLFQLYLHDAESKVTQRASWPVAYCAELHPALMKDHIGQLLANLQRPDLHDAIKRSAVRLLQHIEIPEVYHGEVMDRCFSYVENPTESVAIKAFSLIVLGNLAIKYPDIIPEIKLLIHDQLQYQTPAFKSSAKTVLKNLGKISFLMD